MDNQKKNELIERIAHNLDITPEMYQRAMSVVTGLEIFLKSKVLNLDIYKQGSFKLGTIIKPYMRDRDGDFDIDIVVQFPYDKTKIKPSAIKEQLGKYLKEQNYFEYLDDEGRRCWTLNYTHKNGNVVVFHIDLLPCVSEEDNVIKTINPDELKDSAIAITHIEDKRTKPYTYSWKTSNPRGYAEWFDGVNYGKYRALKSRDKLRILNENRNLFNTENDISDDYTRSPLQMVIQILKRHRDIMFSAGEKADYKPISIIITTLVGKIVEENFIVQNNTYDLLNAVLKGLEYYSSLVKAGIDSDFAEEYKTKKLISKRNIDGKPYWSIKNPANSMENLADKWNKNSQYATSFFEWVKQVRTDLIDILEHSSDQIKSKFKYCLGEDVANSTFGKFVFDTIVAPRKIEPTVIVPKPYKGNE